MDLMKYIPVGRKNAITAEILAARAGYRSVRALMQDIHNLRANGKLILSATERPQGYFIPGEGDKEEVRHFLCSMRSRINKIEVAAKPAEQYLKNNSI